MTAADTAELLTLAIKVVDSRLSPTEPALDAAIDALAVLVERLAPATTVAECRSIADAAFEAYWGGR